MRARPQAYSSGFAFVLLISGAETAAGDGVEQVQAAGVIGASVVVTLHCVGIGALGVEEFEKLDLG